MNGTVIRESTVDKKTHLDANSASEPYFLATMAVVAPAGMEVRITLTPAMVAWG